jgi:hypothetical protein
MNYLSKPIIGFLLLTSQLFSGRVSNFIQQRLRADTATSPHLHKALHVVCNMQVAFTAET